MTASVGDFVTGLVLRQVSGPPFGPSPVIQGVVLATEGYDGALLLTTVGGRRVLVAPAVTVVPILITDEARELVRDVLAGEVRS